MSPVLQPSVSWREGKSTSITSRHGDRSAHEWGIISVLGPRVSPWSPALPVPTELAVTDDDDDDDDMLKEQRGKLIDGLDGLRVANEPGKRTKTRCVSSVPVLVP